jgi:hypothetical protein
MTRLLLLSVVLVFASCATNDSQVKAGPQEDSTVNQSKPAEDGLETRLGESNYFIILPKAYAISEARGKEGQLGYNIMPKDTASTAFGFIELEHGRSIGGFSRGDALAKDSVQTDLAGKKVQWMIYETESGYFEATTAEQSSLNARASAKSRSELDSLVTIISTLKLKQ